MSEKPDKVKDKKKPIKKETTKRKRQCKREITAKDLMELKWKREWEIEKNGKRFRNM